MRPQEADTSAAASPQGQPPMLSPQGPRPGPLRARRRRREETTRRKVASLAGWSREAATAPISTLPLGLPIVDFSSCTPCRSRGLQQPNSLSGLGGRGTAGQHPTNRLHPADGRASCHLGTTCTEIHICMYVYIHIHIYIYIHI